ncbi:MAG: hypothetical protein V1817_04145 [Candidatus Micrarchaeota archaeon]
MRPVIQGKPGISTRGINALVKQLKKIKFGASGRFTNRGSSVIELQNASPTHLNKISSIYASKTVFTEQLLNQLRRKKFGVTIGGNDWGGVDITRGKLSKPYWTKLIKAIKRGK